MDSTKHLKIARREVGESDVRRGDIFNLLSPFLPWRRVVTATPRRHFPRELLRRSVRPCLRHQRAL